MRAQNITVGLEVDVIRVNYECSQCRVSYTERQFDMERNPACGVCGGALEKLWLVIARREPAVDERDAG